MVVCLIESSMNTTSTSTVNSGLESKVGTTTTESASGRPRKDAAMPVVQQSLAAADITVSGS